MDIPGTSTNNTEQQWAQVIECPICYNIYDKPMQMGCGHTLCVTCIGRLVDQVKTNQANDQAQGNPPMGARLALNPEEHNALLAGLNGLGGLNDQLDEAQFLEIPHLDNRNQGIMRGIIGFPPRRVNGTEIKCPECRKPTTVPPEGLPINYRVQEMVQNFAPLFKDRHLVKHCTQCEAVLAQGVYFDCTQCGEDKGHKICSTCAIRLHNGHELVEKKALTSEDVVKMKKMINEASHRAFQAFENIKPRMETVGGAIETKINEKLAALIKIFEFMLGSFDSKIKDTSTVDELMVEVKKAEKVAEVYERAADRATILLNSIEAAFNTYWEPFEQLKQEMDYQIEPAPPAPAVVANPNPMPNNQNPMDMFDPHGVAAAAAANVALRAFRGQQQNARPAAAHFAQVDRVRQRARQPPPQPPQMPPQRGMHPMWGPQLGGLQQMVPQMGPGPIRQGRMVHGPPQQPPMDQPIPQADQAAVINFFRAAQGVQMPPHPHGPLRFNNGGNMPNIQIQQNIPLPPQMPNFLPPPPPPQHQQQQMNHHHHHHPQQMNQHPQHQHPQQMQQRRDMQPPPQMQNRPMYYQNQMMMRQFPQQGGVQPQQLHQQLEQLQQHQQLQQLVQAQQQHANQQQALQQQQLQQEQQQVVQQQMQQMVQPPEPREDVPRDPNWDNIQPDNNVPFDMQFENPVAVEQVQVEGIDQEQHVVRDIVDEIDHAVQNYAGGINIIQFQEENGMGIPNAQDMHDMVQNLIQPGPEDVQDNDVLQELPEEEVQQDDQGVQGFVEFRDMLQQVEAIDEENFDQDPIDPIEQQDQLDEVEIIHVGMRNDIVEMQVDDDEEAVRVVEEHEREQEVPNPAPRRNQRREMAPEVADQRRTTRRSVRNSSGPVEEAPATEAPTSSSAAAQRSLSPPATTKRRKVDKKQKADAPEDTEADEPVDPVIRPQKRRAATSTPSTSSNGQSSSAPTTRSQTRS
uniref:RING-type domain-containing protein n=1 Tax=Caenorhabditis tropicalis TaxID=1561998 RepID=A0A1I7U2X7_9PELO